MADSGGYFKMNGTSSGSTYMSKGVTAGMSVLEMVEKLTSSKVCSPALAAHVKSWVSARTKSGKSEVSLVAFRGAVAASTPSVLLPTRAVSKYDDERLVMAVVDVVGPPPSVERVPDLKAALAELDKQIGLKAVKEQAHVLVKLAHINYQRELNCEEPHLVPLNRLFLGNPGTGKTTVAKIYGRILKGLGYLSDGSVEVKTPSDLIASAAGGTEEKTAAVLEVCKGKVLVVDEAYGLHEGM